MQKPFIVAVETSSRIGSVAIALGEKILAETAFSAPIRHSAEIFPAIGDILHRFGRKPGQIEQVHISVGPGSFTGLRIEHSPCHSEHSPCHSERSEESPERIAAITDAKRGHFFIAVYKRNTSDEQPATSDGIWEKVFPDSLMTPSQFLDQFACDEKPIWLLGDGLLYYKDKFKADTVRFLHGKYWSPRASKVHLLGWKKASVNQFADPLTLTPNYLLRPDIKIKPR